MNKSQRIYLNTGITGNVNVDKHIKVRLEQNVQTIEMLSMKIGTSEVYQNFNADYGVLVGRVVANGGVGIQNAKISIFIPLDDVDAENGDIVSVYPYTTPREKNNEGKRYNLLPRVSQIDQITNTYKPKQPFGSFPIKPEITINETLNNVYKKYYKYTALTNQFGDYMMFGVPIGVQIVHMSVDTTDIGEYSMNPASMVTNLGYSPNLFTDNNTRIKETNDLNDLPHIETQEISVEIIPFWGDVENFQIGITRQDFKIKATLVNQFTIFGSVFTDDENSRWANDFRIDNEKFAIEQLYRISKNEDYNISIRSKRIAKVTEKIYYYPNSVSDFEIAQNGVDLYKKALVLDPSEYTIHRRDGDFIFIINCNRKKMITGDNGNKIEVSESYNGGVYTEFKGFITLEILEEDLRTPNKKIDDTIGEDTRSVTLFRTRIKIPQQSNISQGFDNQITAHLWRNAHYTFTANNVYSIAKFNGIVYNRSGSDSSNGSTVYIGYEDSDKINKLKEDPYFSVGIIKTTENDNDLYEFPSNGLTDINKPVFGANWLNFSIYLPQIGYVVSDEFGGMRVNTFFQRFKSTNLKYLTDNDEPIAATEVNTKWFLRSDLHWTNFIKVDENDIKTLNNFPKKGGNDIDDIFFAQNPIIKTNYMNGQKPCPINGGKVGGLPTGIVDQKVYFYKGFDSADCIEYVADVLNIK